MEWLTIAVGLPKRLSRDCVWIANGFSVGLSRTLLLDCQGILGKFLRRIRWDQFT